MRLGNYDVETIRTSDRVILRDGIEVEIQPLPPDWDDLVARELPPPRPKQIDVERDRKGKILHDDTGRPIPKYDVENEGYQRALARHQKRQALHMLLTGLAPGEMLFDAERGEDLGAYLDAVLEELKAFGFSMGDLIRVVKAIGNLSGLTDEDLEVAERSFFGATI